MRLSVFLTSLFLSINASSQVSINGQGEVLSGSEPIAYYKRSVNSLLPRYDYIFLNEKNEELFSVLSRKYEAPVEELNPFYYYVMIFASNQDSFAIFFDGHLFTETLVDILTRYPLIKQGRIDTAAKRQFLTDYDQEPILSRLRDMEAYLDKNRYYDKQVDRNRSKPVKLVNNRNIMQDGKLIGYVLPYNEYSERYPAGNATASESTSTNRVRIALPDNSIVAEPNTDLRALQTRADGKRHYWDVIMESIPRKNRTDPDEKLLTMVKYFVERYYL